MNTHYDDNNDCLKWGGPGWYAPKQEGRGDSQHAAYYHCGYDQDYPPITRHMGLGTPTWYDSVEEWLGE